MPRVAFITTRVLICSLFLASLALAQDAASGAGYSTTSNAEGRFTLELFPPGDSIARAVADKMSTQETPLLHVDLGAAAELDFHLSVASACLTLSGGP